ncbi:MAG: helix-turn-helix transcriptional regulator [Xanthomonadaceae bacterium]|nr:helix-turn-helix transcriptional regulator [Xanthomonadaceae bacterium]
MASHGRNIQLVEAGPDGLPATAIAERLGIPANTLSFHVKALSQADLLSARHEGRFIYYSANFTRMNDLVDFLTDNCCGGRPCTTAARSTRQTSGASS